ncbi:MAG: flagellar export chaperone FliS, partial [Desulfobulbaceae bacterium]|nr:flagellar export chaperone FliS [Desulfobulbaceae bacterium]
MNMYSNNYLQNQIATSSPEQLLIMFYDGAIRFTMQAIGAIENDDIQQRTYTINKATAIISELAATLDHKVGGKIAKELDGLYAYMIRELNMANVKNDAALLEPVESILTDLRQTWVEAIDINRQST